MTDAQWLAWLKDPKAIRVVLIEANASVAGVETPFYLSTRGGYQTKSTDTPANQVYRPIAAMGVLVTERLAVNLGGDATLAAGTVEIQNYNGERSAWRGYVWDNRAITAILGDPSWPLADFRPIFDGTVARLSPNGRNAFSLNMRDKLQRLNTALTEEKLGGATQNKDALLPLCFGEVHNVTPLLVDPVTLEYMVHDGQIERIIEVRDNGVPLANDTLGWAAVTRDLAAGTFTLTAAPFGAITCDVQGDKPAGVYSNTVGALVQRLVTGYGIAASRFLVGDLDTVNLAAFEAAHPQPVGLYLTARTNVLVACKMLASSLGAQISMSRLGLMRLLKIDLPAAGTPTEVRPKHMVENTLTPTGYTDVVGAITLGYCKSWTVQPGLVTTIPYEHADMYANEWSQSTATNPAVLAAYRLSAETIQQDTMLTREVDADAEGARLLDMWSVPHTTYEFEATPEMQQLEIGQTIAVYADEFDMDGALAQVIMLAPGTENGHVKVGFIV